jgi:hypothetical protein
VFGILLLGAILGAAAVWTSRSPGRDAEPRVQAHPAAHGFDLVAQSQGGGGARLYLAPRGGSTAGRRPFVRGVKPLRIEQPSVVVDEGQQSDPGVVPTSKGTLVAWTHVRDMTVALVDRSGDVEKLFYADTEGWVGVDRTGHHLLVRTPSPGSTESCYAGAVTSKPRKIATAQRCMFTDDGTVFAGDPITAGQGERITVFDVEGRRLGAYRTESWANPSPDGTRVLVRTTVVTDPTAQPPTTTEVVTVLDARTGRTVASRTGARLQADWAGPGATLVYSYQRDNRMRLGVIAPGGPATDVAEGDAVWGTAVGDEGSMIAASLVGAKVTLTRVDVGTGRKTKLLEGTDLGFEVLPGSAPSVVAWTVSGSHVWYGRADEGRLSDLGDIPGLSWVERIAYDGSRKVAYLSTQIDDDRISLYELGDTMELVTSGWSDVEVLDANAGAVVSKATDLEGEVLVATIDGTDEQLDDADHLLGAAIDGADVIYTRTTSSGGGGARAEVRRVPLDGSDRPRTLSSAARIEGRDDPRPALYTVEMSAEYATDRHWIGAHPTCPPGTPSIDHHAAGPIGPAGIRLCLAAPFRPGSLQLSGASPQGLSITVRDAEGNVVMETVAHTKDPDLEENIRGGLFTVELHLNSAEQGTYELDSRFVPS